MKVRIHELAEELDVSERTVITWLSRKGYPGARSNDWLTPKLARTARVALRRSDYHYPRSSHLEPNLGSNTQHFSQRLSWVDSEYSGSLPPIREDSHSESSAAATETDLTAVKTPLSSTSEQEPGRANHALERERSRSELLLKRLEGLREYHERRYQELHQKYESTVEERTSLKQRVHSMTQNQETLDVTCHELTQERDQTRREISDLKEHLHAQEKMGNAIDKVNQQKQAWRARALALEERVQTNQHLTNQLKELGMDTLDQQIQLFQTLLTSPESANQLFNAIKMVEHEEVRVMVEKWVIKTCAHPLCNQVNILRRKLSFRVDRPHRCQVCSGDSSTRWFQRMIAGCERAHVKRFLLVGGESIHARIRELTEGKMIEFRLIPTDDESSDQRIQSRLGSCDLLITWPRGQLSSEAGMRYRRAAPIVDCPALDLNGDQAELIRLSRQILNWVARTGGRVD